jgi:hypothetical protein
MRLISVKNDRLLKGLDVPSRIRHVETFTGKPLSEGVLAGASLPAGACSDGPPPPAPSDEYCRTLALLRADCAFAVARSV